MDASHEIPFYPPNWWGFELYLHTTPGCSCSANTLVSARRAPALPSGASETGARPQNWELLQHCPFLTAPRTAVLLNKVLTQAQVKSRQKFHQFQSKLHFTSTNGVTGRPHRNPDIGKLRDFSWQVQPCWASSATPARCKQTYFPWKTEAEDT